MIRYCGVITPSAYTKGPTEAGPAVIHTQILHHHFLEVLGGPEGNLLAGLDLMASPVAGFRPMRAARLRTWRMPSPGMRIRSPFFKCFPEAGDYVG